MSSRWRMLWRNPAVLILHLSFLLVIVGGISTWLTQERGYVRLIPGEKTDTFLSSEGRIIHLPAVLELDSFRVEYYPGGIYPRDYVSVLKVDGQPARISMNRILETDGYRFCQSGYDYDGSSILTVNHDPLGMPLVYTGFLMFTLSGLWILVCKLRGHRHILIGLVLILAGAMGLTAYLMEYRPSGPPLMPVLNSRWLPVHVSLAMTSYALFALTFVIALVAVISPERAQKMQRISLLALYPAEWLLGLGIITGAVWANISWGRYWSWDPKETLALVTFLVYALPLHRSVAFLNNSRRFHIYMMFAILAVIATYFGVNLLPSLHAYN